MLVPPTQLGDFDGTRTNDAEDGLDDERGVLVAMLASERCVSNR